VGVLENETLKREFGDTRERNTRRDKIANHGCL
jgi:hypothetical protein